MRSEYDSEKILFFPLQANLNDRPDQCRHESEISSGLLQCVGVIQVPDRAVTCVATIEYIGDTGADITARADSKTDKERICPMFFIFI